MRSQGRAINERPLLAIAKDGFNAWDRVRRWQTETAGRYRIAAPITVRELAQSVDGGRAPAITSGGCPGLIVGPAYDQCEQILHHGMCVAESPDPKKGLDPKIGATYMARTAAVGHTVCLVRSPKFRRWGRPPKRGWLGRRSFALFDIVGQDEGTCGRRLRVRHSRCRELGSNKSFHRSHNTSTKYVMCRNGSLR